MLWYKRIRSTQAFKLSPSKRCLTKKDDSNTVAWRDMLCGRFKIPKQFIKVDSVLQRTYDTARNEA